MDNKLILTVLFLTLTWLSASTMACGNSTTDATNSTMGSNMTACGNGTADMNNSTTGSNMTATGNTTADMNNSTMGSNMTATGNTTADMNNSTMGSNMTATGNTTADMNNSTMGSNMTATGNTTADMNNSTTGSNMTATGNTTADMNNSTTGSNMTATGNTTAMPTAAPPIMPNTTVETLATPISREECGSQQLCAAEPSTCNPSTAESCFFLAVKQQSGQNFEFGLSGQSEGYIAATLSTDSSLGGNDTTYVCARNGSVVTFIGTVLNDGQLIPTMLNVNSVKGSINGGRIQCTFAATVPSQTTKTTNFALGISTGPFNSQTGSLGSPRTRLRSPVINLENPRANVSNQVSSNSPTAAPTTVAMTTCGGIALQQSLTQALLIVGALCMAVL